MRWDNACSGLAYDKQVDSFICCGFAYAKQLAIMFILF